MVVALVADNELSRQDYLNLWIGRDNLPSFIKGSLRCRTRAQRTKELKGSDFIAKSSEPYPDDIRWIYQLLDLDNIQLGVL